MLSVILTFEPLYRKNHVNIDMYSSMQAHSKMINYVNVGKSLSVNISFLINGQNNEHLFLKPRFHELLSQNGGELMS